MPLNPIGLLKFYTGSQPDLSRTPSFRPLQIAQSGMSAQLLRMEVAAANIANAETTRVGEAGSGPYQRRVVRLAESGVPGAPPTFPPLPPLTPAQPGASADPADPTLTAGGVQAVAVETDASPGPLVYDPGHPDADAQGYVRYPNVRVTDEITELMDARRIYEANASVFQAAKLMLRRALDI
jgi:flagellar basal-body rod protein FlgC